MRKWKFIGTEAITPGAAKSYKVPSGRYLGLFVRLTGTTDSGQTLALSEIGGFRLQRGGTVIQSETFEFYSDFNDLTRGFPEATLPTAGATSTSCFIPFFAPGLRNTMEVTNDEELVLFFDPASGLSTEFGANAITVEVQGIIETEVAESYQLEIVTQDFTASATGKKSVTITKNNVAYLLLVDGASSVSTVQLDVDDRNIIPSVDLDVLNSWANMEWRVEASGNNIVPLQTGSVGSLGSYLNNSTILLPTFTSTGTLQITVLSIQPSPAGVAQLSSQRVKAVQSENAKLAQRKLVNFTR